MDPGVSAHPRFAFRRAGIGARGLFGFLRPHQRGAGILPEGPRVTLVLDGSPRRRRWSTPGCRGGRPVSRSTSTATATPATGRRSTRSPRSCAGGRVSKRADLSDRGSAVPCAQRARKCQRAERFAPLSRARPRSSRGADSRESSCVESQAAFCVFSRPRTSRASRSLALRRTSILRMAAVRATFGSLPLSSFSR